MGLGGSVTGDHNRGQYRYHDGNNGAKPCPGPIYRDFAETCAICVDFQKHRRKNAENAAERRGSPLAIIRDFDRMLRKYNQSGGPFWRCDPM